MRTTGYLAMAVLLGQAAAVSAQEAPPTRLQEGFYVAPMLGYTFADSRWHADDGIGGQLGAGYRSNSFALEISGALTKLGSDEGSKDTQLTGAGVDVLFLPFKAAPNFYFLAGGGNLFVKDFARIGAGGTVTSDKFGAQYLQGGLGNIFPISIGRYDFGIRAQALARHAEHHRDGRSDPENPLRFLDYVVGVGLQLPLGLRPEPPPAPVVPPVAVVAPAAVCSDSQDNDGDGKVDFPADPGCSSADDNDETDPPQCSDGKDNDGDGLIDFPADKGCSAADDNDETDPCKTPAPGERITLKGCGTGDTIVLRGVNFDFDKATLTVNAKTILDNVAEELSAYPEIKVELSGHTDSKGSDEYNQKLSDRRAASVLKYLASKGIAAERMTSIGYGESKPVADNETDEGRELNRRVELRITEGVAGAQAAAPSTVDAAAPEAAATSP